MSKKPKEHHTPPRYINGGYGIGFTESSDPTIPVQMTLWKMGAPGEVNTLLAKFDPMDADALANIIRDAQAYVEDTFIVSPFGCYPCTFKWGDTEGTLAGTGRRWEINDYEPEDEDDEGVYQYTVWYDGCEHGGDFESYDEAIDSICPNDIGD